MNTPRPQTGFSIVEVMVALVVLAVGMLGIASLYVTTLRSSGSAISRMQAVSLASDMADRIRANRFARDAYANIEPANNGCFGIESSADCSQDRMAANDLFVWQAQIDDALPGDPQGTVAFTLGGEGEDGEVVPDSYDITVAWDERGDGDGDGDGEGDLRQQLQYTMTMQVQP